MSNTDQVAIVRRTYTESITFVGKPSEERRVQLKAAGYKFENGNWYRSRSDSQLASDDEVAKQVAA